MTTFKEIVEEFERIKDEPEAVDQARVTENPVGGTSADATEKRQKGLPTDEQHYKLQARLSDMFDTTKRAGAQSSAGGMILPGGRQNFAAFHDNFTGTGRIPKKETPSFAPAPNAPKVDTPPLSVSLHKNCTVCRGPIDPLNCVYDQDYIPPQNRFSGELDMWRAVGLKPGMIVGSVSCVKCDDAYKAEYQKILHNPITNAIKVMGPHGQPVPQAYCEAAFHLLKHRMKKRQNVFAMIAVERDDPLSDCFCGAAVCL